MDNVVKMHGIHRSIVSDRDKVFTSLFWKELISLSTKLLMSMAYHPETDGQSERVNQCLESYLRCLSFLQPKGWHKWLTVAQWWYNSSFHSSIKMTLEALYGYKPVLLPVIGRQTTVAISKDRKL